MDKDRGTARMKWPPVFPWTVRSSRLSAGSHAITASYGGDANFDLTLSPVFTQLLNP